MEFTQSREDTILDTFAFDFVMEDDAGKREKLFFDLKNNYGESIFDWKNKCRQKLKNRTRASAVIKSFDNLVKQSDIYDHRNDIPDVFNTEDYICKFYFSATGYGAMKYYPKVSVDLYLKTLTIEIFDENDKFEAVFGYHIDGKMDTLLPLVRWKDFEKTRDVSGWDMENSGYRDGWGYDFLCMNESGNPLIRNHLDVTFKEAYKPAYEKLFDWVKQEYFRKKELRKYCLPW